MGPVVALFGRTEAAGRCLLLGVERTCRLSRAASAFDPGWVKTLMQNLSDGDLLAAWPTLATPEKRRLLHGLLDRVILQRAGARGRLAPPIGERTQIVLRGNVLLEPDGSDLPS